ncbi:MipA/OmpV family protein [Paracidovorax konjaci]|uniref:Outer membrane scaffolding protein for murein synthesis, MipA/OmpV family n=1 Tax=Paracidovorax konjaci TaxID=32040 RepID=A0A1I1UKK2_9BURK|nr:MipA/OmpV family protein [Paracidovorax konjaci]SFD71287.1 Outer membrane scaffolding protein for murein synthesis, MipA/OmpV family [Paracidovorax konjaci]
MPPLFLLRSARIGHAGSVVLALLATAGPALAAQDSLFGDKTELAIGAGAAWAPRYAGSGDARMLPVPVLSVQRGILFADTSRGLGLQYQFDSGLYLSQSIHYDLGRQERDSNWRPGSVKLLGMGRVPGSVTARTLLVQQIGSRLSLSAEAEFALRDTARRNRYRVGMEVQLLQTGSDTVSASLDAHGGDRRFNQAYFGVTAAQAGRTGLQAFTTGAGLYAGSVGMQWEHRFAPHWAGTLQVVGTHYLDNAARSPVVKQDNTVAATAALTYSY